jgi:hypothetical protein
MRFLKLPGEWDPGIDNNLLPLLESDQEHVKIATKVIGQPKLGSLQIGTGYGWELLGCLFLVCCPTSKTVQPRRQDLPAG